MSKYQSNETDGILGIALILIGALLFIWMAYAYFISKYFMPYTGHKLLDWIKDDDYYCCLVPSTLVVFFLFTYINWISMKYFRHS